MIEVLPSVIEGSVLAPPSKSYSHRALAISLICERRSEIEGVSTSRDVAATLNAISMMGANIEVKGEGSGLKVSVDPPERPKVPNDVVDCEGSGTTIRFFAAISTLTEDGYTVLTGNESLRRRPMGPIIGAIMRLGGWAISTRMNGLPPLVVRGGGLRGGYVELDGSISSQFFSGLMIASTRFHEGIRLKPMGELVSEPYVRMTEEVLRRSGARVELGEEIEVDPVRPKKLEFRVPGDFGLAAPLMAMASITGGRVRVEGLDRFLPQADSLVLELLREFGVQVREGDNYVSVEGMPKEAVRINLKDAPDLLPVACVLAASVEGTSEIRGVAHARVKESDRVRNMALELSKMGTWVQELEDGLLIRGGRLRGGVRLSPHGDHRILMALVALAAAADEGCVIEDEGCVADSYPSFLEDSIKLGLRVRT
ncbi:MAG: 3-phosphoshikimate 1-carboxyvinyltransferase, partial [Candidatus Korarchaeum sp.]